MKLSCRSLRAVKPAIDGRIEPRRTTFTEPLGSGGSGPAFALRATHTNSLDHTVQPRACTLCVASCSRPGGPFALRGGGDVPRLLTDAAPVLMITDRMGRPTTPHGGRGVSGPAARHGCRVQRSSRRLVRRLHHFSGDVAYVWHARLRGHTMALPAGVRLCRKERADWHAPCGSAEAEDARVRLVLEHIDAMDVRAEIRTGLEGARLDVARSRLASTPKRTAIADTSSAVFSLLPSCRASTSLPKLDRSSRAIRYQ